MFIVWNEHLLSVFLKKWRKFLFYKFNISLEPFKRPKQFFIFIFDMFFIHEFLKDKIASFIIVYHITVIPDYKNEVKSAEERCTYASVEI